MSYVDEVIQLVIEKNPAEPEFHQAVKEVLESLRVVVEANEEKFRDMYNKIILPSILGEVNGNIGTEMCSFQFSYNTGTPSETLVFYEYGELYAAAKVNGRVDFYVKRSSVNDMMSAINKLAE